MGLLYTTDGTRRVVNTLNTAFDGPGKGLDAIRQFVASADPRVLRKIRNRKWQPARLARMLQLLPYDQDDQTSSRKPLSNRATRRWHYFLKTVVGSATTDGSVFAILRNALADAILNQDVNGAALSIVRVSFDHVELQDPQNDMNIVIFDVPLKASDPSAGMVRHITLFTVSVPQKNQDGTPFNGTPFDPPDSDLPDSTAPKPAWNTDPGTDPWNNPNP